MSVEELLRAWEREMWRYEVERLSADLVARDFSRHDAQTLKNGIDYAKQKLLELADEELAECADEVREEPA